MRSETRYLLAMARGPVLTWLALMLLAAGTFAVAVAPIAPGSKPVIHIAILAVQLVLIGVFFMNLRVASSLPRFAALAGLYWLTIMFVLTFSDYGSRPLSSPCGAAAFANTSAGQCATAAK